MAKRKTKAKIKPRAPELRVFMDAPDDGGIAVNGNIARTVVRSSRSLIDADEIIVDNFAGGGGASTGVADALGRSPDVAVNHDPEAIAMHAANHPDTEHHVKDVYEVDPVEACRGRKVGFAWFSPDCFPAGTLVLTRRGYEPIETLEVGDQVLTHHGRWRPITATMSTRRKLLRLRGHGHPGLLVSPEHPFYARPNKLGATEWTLAKDLDVGHYWASPCEFPADGVPPIPTIRNRQLAISPDVFWLAGRYVADGWSRLDDKRAELVITCGSDEIGELRAKFETWKRVGARAGSDEMAWYEREIPGVNGHGSYQFTTSHRGLVTWLRDHFGHGSEFKSIPSWALGMPRDLRAALLEGYVSGDGWRGDNRGEIVETCTVSKALAFSSKALAQSLGYAVAVYHSENSCIIEGRAVNAKPIYQLRWRANPKQVQTTRSGHLEFAPIREREEDVDVGEVFNISVADDESYVVEGIVVHNCTHHSKAKGGKPKSQKIRGLAWVAVRWAAAVRPRVIALENVEEFLDWGPLVREHTHGCTGEARERRKTVKGKPKITVDSSCRKGCKYLTPIEDRKGETFRAFVRKLEKLGYVVEWRILRAHDYGAPTTRKRLFLVARCDGREICWPEPTHGPGREEAHRPAADIIDWSIPSTSIFDRKKKPLADKTMARVARGVSKFVINAANPFLIPLNHGGYKNDGTPREDHRVHDIADPMPTITGQRRGEHAVVSPLICKVKTYGGGGNDAKSAAEPLGTVTASKRGEHAVIAPYLVHRSNGERPGQAPRIYDAQRPLGTIVAQGQKQAVCAAVLVKHYSERPTGGDPCFTGLDKSIATVTSRDHHSLLAVHLSKMYGTSTGSDIADPTPTITANDKGGGHLAAVAANLVKYSRTGGPRDVDDPIDTLTTKPRYGLVETGLADAADMSPEQLERARQVAKFLRKYGVSVPGEFATVTIDGEEFVIADIEMRMLAARELYRAQGFPEEYRVEDVMFEGKPLSKTAQIRMCGNSVCPPLAAAVARAQFEQPEERIAA